MCGICGIVGSFEQEPLRRMTGAMAHRGPDEESVSVEPGVGLGFRRLAIIDVAGGHQPIRSEDGLVTVLFNGEIYNHLDLRRELASQGHAFRSMSDGEVLPHLYEECGEALVDRLNGIFAIAIWDASRHRLVLARDHHGVKPLYYASSPERCVFASEIKALLASGLVDRRIDPACVAHYLRLQAVPPPLSILRHVHQLAPGGVAIYERGRCCARAYWNPPRQAEDVFATQRDAIEAVRTGLRSAVRRQLVSERPLGVFLSGGLDSSTMVALAATEVGRRLQTFSVGFVGRDEHVFTEWPWARLVAERYGTDHHEYVLTEATFVERLPHVLRAMDQPTADGVNSYYVSFAAASDVTVALSGTGADELLLGYDRDGALLDQFAEGAALSSLPGSHLDRVARWLRGIPDDTLWQGVASAAGQIRVRAALDAELLAPRGIGIFSATECRRLLGTATASRNADHLDDLLRSVVPADSSRPGDWLARAEQRAYLSWVLLRDIDAMSMAHSLEVRVPFLDRELGEILRRVPWNWKRHGSTGKWVLRQAVADLLPEETLTRPKMGFGLPYQVWMRGKMAPMLRDTLSVQRVRRRGLVDPAVTELLVQRFYRGDDSVWRQVWTLFVLEAWAEHVLDGARR